MSKLNIDSDTLDFLDDTPEEEEVINGRYKILIADDEEEVHNITKFVLSHFEFHGKTLEFLDTYTGEETKKLFEKEKDIAVVFLDVVMEDNHAGLSVVEYLRNDLKNYVTRIILRTGQPGEAPEESVIRDYDINDYKLKTELTSRRLTTTMYAALRNYRDLKQLEHHKKGLEKIISASSSLFNKKTLDDFLISILEELASFQYGSEGVVFMRREGQKSSGIISQKEENGESRIIAATGMYSEFNGRKLESVPQLKHLQQYLNSEYDGNTDLVRRLDNGLVVLSASQSLSRNIIYVEGNPDGFDFELINLFLTHFSIALENLIMTDLVQETQEEIVYALAETVESHFEETGNHVKCVSNMMYRFAQKLHFSNQEAEMIRLASTMHDVGKIAISNTILQKPGKLTVEEFEIVKTHTSQGFKILNGSDLPVLKQAAVIAVNHHEKFDGSGYPARKRGRDIPLSGRMMAIVDVYDALTHKRCYKEAMSEQEAVNILNEGSGSHFDPELLRVFFDNNDYILSR